jgi:hypothetical protein
MRVSGYEQRLHEAISERAVGELTGNVAWAAFIATSREPVQPSLASFHESFQLEAASHGQRIVVSLRRRLDHIDDDGDEVDATTYHCELIFAEPGISDDFDDIVLDEETDPRVLSVADLDRHGRAIPALGRLLASPVELNIFADGME